MTRIIITAGISLVVLIAVIAVPVSAVVLIPIDELASFNEYAHVHFDETKASGNSNWGKGIEAMVQVFGECDRPDGHDIASWTSILVYSSNSADFYHSFHQIGWIQVQENCDMAIPFFQSCNFPCEDPSDYTPISAASPIEIPEDGLPGKFRVQIGDVTGPNPEEPCIFRNTMGLRCPIGMTQDDLIQYTCIGTAYFTDGEVRCADEDELVILAGQKDKCEDIVLSAISAYIPFCQGVEAANQILENDVSYCEDADSPSNPIFDDAVCFISDTPHEVQEPVATNCVADFFFDDVYVGSSAITVPCGIAKEARIEYEAADNLGTTHIGPGGDDQPTKFLSWRYVGASSLSSVNGDDIIFNTAGKADCPPYEGRYRTSSNLVEFAELGPNLGSANTDWCGEDMSQTPALGVTFIIAALIGISAIIRRRNEDHVK